MNKKLIYFVLSFALILFLSVKSYSNKNGILLANQNFSVAIVSAGLRVRVVLADGSIGASSYISAPYVTKKKLSFFVIKANWTVDTSPRMGYLDVGFFYAFLALFLLLGMKRMYKMGELFS